jgi:hypothetical protein
VPAGRLFLDVREDRSLAYSARGSIFELAHGPEPLLLYAGTETAKTDAALQATLDDLDGMIVRRVTAGETESSRRYLSALRRRHHRGPDARVPDGEDDRFRPLGPPSGAMKQGKVWGNLGETCVHSPRVQHFTAR